MKDPLQHTNTPYDILGIPITADHTQILLAFKNSFNKRGIDQGEIRDAYNKLSNSQERALVDLFLYHEPFLDHLIPRINGDEKQLLDRRTEIAQSWSNIQRQTFTNFAATHSLAVLWYIWALYCEDGKDSEKKSTFTSFSLTQLWSNALSHWVFLRNSPEFMSEWIKSKGINGIDPVLLGERLESFFRNKLSFFKEKYQNEGDTLSVKRFEEYELIFDSEMKAAKLLPQIYDEGLQFTRNGSPITVCCGPTMLEKLGMLDSIRTQIEGFIKKDPQNTNLKQILNRLSPFANIYTLLDNKKYGEVLKAIEALPPNDQKNKELLSIQAKACLERGKQETQNRNYKKSTEYLKQGLDTGELKSELTEAIVANCIAEVTSLSDLDAIIRVIEDTLKIITDSRLRDLLSEKYIDRGISRFNKAYNKWESSKKTSQEKDNAEYEIEKGIEDFENALKINPSNKRARESLENAKRLLEMIEAAEAIILNARGLELVDEATELTKKGNFTEALKKINEAERVLTEAHNKAPSNNIIESNLAHIKAERKEIEVLMLNARGLELANEAMKLQNEVKTIIQNGATKFKDEEFLSNTFHEISNKNKEAERLLTEAEKLLTEAYNQAPSNKIIKSNLDQIRDELKKIRDINTPVEEGFLSKLCSTVDTLLMALFFYPGLGIVLASFAQLVYSIGLQGAFLIGFTSEYSGTNRIEYIQGIFFGFLLIIASLILSYGNLKNAESRPNSPVRAVIKYVLVFCLCLAALYVVHPPWISQFN